MLLVGSKLDRHEKNVSVLNFARVPPSFHQTWKKLLCLSKDHTSVPMHGHALMDMIMWEWKNITSQSFIHIMWTFAAVVIAKAGTIISY